MQLRHAAEALGVHYQTAYGWVRQGTLPARRTPRGYEVSEGDIGDLLARRAAGAEPSPEIQVRDWAAQAGCTRRWRRATRPRRGRLGGASPQECR